MNNLVNRLREHKNKGTSFYILIGLNIIFLAVAVINLVNNTIGSVKALDVVFTLALPLLFTTATLWYEKRGLSFVAHFIFFVHFLESYIRDFYNALFIKTNFGDFMLILLGVVASLYVILKLFAHYDEIRAQVPAIGRRVMILVIVALVGLYFTQNFLSALLFAVIMLIAAASSNHKMVLPIVILIYTSRIVQSLNRAYILSNINSFGGSEKVDMIINMLFSGLIIFYAIKLLKEDETRKYVS